MVGGPARLEVVCSAALDRFILLAPDVWPTHRYTVWGRRSLALAHGRFFAGTYLCHLRPRTPIDRLAG